MAKPRPSAANDLIHRICDAEDLPSLPAVAIRVLELTQTENASVNKIAELVGQDPVLTARVLKLVNSSLFGISRRIVSLPQAIIVLGLRTLKVLTLSLSIVDTFGRRRVDWFDYRMYWRRSLTQGMAARLFAEAAAPPLRDEAFVAGLLSDLGILVMSQTITGEYAIPYREAGGNHTRLLRLERAYLGQGHPEIARALLSQWNLPAHLCKAVGLHHGGRTEGLTESTTKLADVVHLAACVAELFCDGATQDQLDALQQQAASRLGLSRERLESALHEIDEHVRQGAALLSVDIGETVSYQALRDQAILQLAELSVRSEIERSAAQQREATSRQREQELQKAAFTDALSGLANRAAFDQHVRQALQGCLASQRHLGLILCDLDHFKAINDTYGHPVGDQVISAAGDILREFEGRDVFAARYGGEEFALAVAGCTYGRLAQMANCLCQRFHSARVSSAQGVIRFTASIGAASTESLANPTVPDLITLADGNLYKAKRQGRGRACIASPLGTQDPPAEGPAPSGEASR